MARSVTVTSIIAGGRFLADDADGALADTTQCITFVDLLWARLYSFYLAAEPDRFRSEQTITATSGESNYNLPTDWFSTIAVDYVGSASGSDRFELSRLQETERIAYANLAAGQSRKYRVGATQLKLFPTPTAGQTYLHIYLPTAPALAAGGDTIDCRLGHEEYLQLCLARKLLQKEESYDGQWEQQIGKIETELKSEANLRYLNDMVEMVSRSGDRDRPWWWTGGVGY